MNKKLGMEAKSLVFRGVLSLGLVACAPALAEQQQAVAAKAAMPTSDVSRFSHAFHVNKVGFGCHDCHTSLFEQAGGSAKAAGDFTMSSFEKGKYCGACHDGSTAFAATDQGSCARCHVNGVTLPKKSRR